MDLVGVISRWRQNYTFDNALASEKGDLVKCVSLTPSLFPSQRVTQGRVLDLE
jgi:uncharacterized membrane protein